MEVNQDFFRSETPTFLESACRTSHLCRWEHEEQSYLKCWAIQAVTWQEILGQTEHLGKRVLKDHFDINEFGGGDPVRKFSTDFNSYAHWDYVISIYRGFYSLGGTQDMSWDPRETK